jgi:hypothetical protein
MTNDVHILVSVCFSFADHFFTGNREFDHDDYGVYKTCSLGWPHWLTLHQKTRESMSLLEQKKRKEKERKYTESYKYVSHSRKTYSLSVPLSLHRWRSMEMKWSFIFVLATLYRMASLESMLMTKNLTDFISSSCFQSPYNSTRPSKCFGNMVFNTTFLQLVWYHLWKQ